MPSAAIDRVSPKPTGSNHNLVIASVARCIAAKIAAVLRGRSEVERVYDRFAGQSWQMPVRRQDLTFDTWLIYFSTESRHTHPSSDEANQSPPVSL